MTPATSRAHSSFAQAFGRSIAFISIPLFASALFAGNINPSAVSINQIDYRGGVNSVVGEFSVNYSTAGSSGFVNVLNPLVTGDSGWLVRNLPVFSGSTPYNHGSITTRIDLTQFALTNGIDVGSAGLLIDYDPLPSTSYIDVLGNGATAGVFGIGDVKNAVGGGGGANSSVLGYHSAPNLVGLTFDPLGIPLADLKYQPGHPNVQAGDDQCAPMAMANSLQWLEDTNPGLDIPHDHQEGWGGDPMDDSLVAELDRAMGRTMGGDRGDADANTGVWPLDGKMQYLADNDLDGKISVKYLTNGDTSSGSADLDGDVDYDHAGQTATGAGAVFDIDWILGELEDGEDVEMDLYYQPDPPDGRHYVQLVGGGRILGVPFLLHTSDKVQNSHRDDDPLTPLVDESFEFDPFDTEGTGDIDFEWLNPDTGLALNSNAIIDQVISESPIPEPVSAGALLGFGLIALRRRSK
ncbi:MAG TPA: hypothetical protein PK402_00940 [Tepidisphaeraceae bacterium]|nr:hypothetical protein [Tepidisphaeraceae bacterium]